LSSRPAEVDAFFAAHPPGLRPIELDGMIGRRYSPQRLEADVISDLRDRLHQEGEILGNTAIVGPASFYRAVVQCLSPTETATGELQELMQRACEATIRLTAKTSVAPLDSGPTVTQLVDAVSFLAQRQVHLLDMHQTPMDEQGRFYPDAVAVVRSMNERVLDSAHLQIPPLRLAAIGHSFFPLQYRRGWQYSDSATLRSVTNERREANNAARIADLADHLLRRIQTLDESISELPPLIAAVTLPPPTIPANGAVGGAAAAAAAAATAAPGLHSHPSSNSEAEVLDAHTGVYCSTNWLSADGDKTRADLLCAFTGPRDEGIALLTAKLERMGLSGRIRCAANTAIQYTLDDAGRQRHVTVHKVFTFSEQLKAGLWTERGGQLELGGLTVFRSGFAAALAERVQRQRWARALIRHGYESQTPIKAKTAGSAWEQAWANLTALGIDPERTMKGAYCAPVLGNTREYWAIWAFDGPPDEAHKAMFRKLEPDEARQLAVGRWGVDGSDREPSPQHSFEVAHHHPSRKRAAEFTMEVQQPVRASGDSLALRGLENRLAALEEVMSRSSASSANTGQQLSALGQSIELLQTRAAGLEAGQEADRAAHRELVAASLQERSETLHLLRDSLQTFQLSMASAMAAHAQANNEQLLTSFRLIVSEAVVGEPVQPVDPETLAALARGATASTDGSGDVASPMG
jgi:hypothetical protein